MAESSLSPLFTWRSAIASSSSGLPSTARLVALVLSLHMNERGASCFPSVPTIATEAGLSDRAVQKAITCLREAGWLLVNVGGSRQGKRVTSTYRAVFPEGVLELELHETGPVNVVHLSGRGPVNVTAGTGERGSGKDVKSATKPGRAHAHKPGEQPTPADLERLNLWLLRLGVAYSVTPDLFAEELGKVAPWLEATEVERLLEECRRKDELEPNEANA